LPTVTGRTQGENEMEGWVHFLGNEDGVTSIEYAMIAAAVAVGILAAVREVGIWLRTHYDEIANVTP
jgi:Flp pilus assembly pilin Flp